MTSSPLLPIVEDVAHPRAWGYQARLDNILVQLAINAVDDLAAVVTADANPQRIDTSELADDIREDTGFRYSRNKLEGGAGLDFLHAPDRPLAAATRFWDSQGVDVFSGDPGKVYEARLLHDMASDTAITTDFPALAKIDEQLYYIEDDELFEYGATPAKYTHGSFPVKLVALGNSLYTSSSFDGVQRFDPPSYTPIAHDPTTSYGHLWTAKGRVFGGVNNQLWETATTPILVLTLPIFDAVLDVVDAGPAIAVFTTTGTIYLLGLDDNLAVVNLGQYSFIDEAPAFGAFAQGVLGISTTVDNEAGGRVARFYTATVSDDGTTLDNVQLRFQHGDRTTTTTASPRWAFGTRDSIYTVIPNAAFNAFVFWRYYLPTAGYARANEVPIATNIHGALQVDDRLWAISSGAGAALWKEQDTFVASGYVIGPAADFFTARAKQWVSGNLTVSALPAGTEVNLFDSPNIDALSDPNHADWELAIKVQVPGETEVDIKDLTGRNGRYHVAKVDLVASAARTLSPTFRSYSFRAFPSSDRDTILRLPVNVSDQFEAPGKRAMIRRGRGVVLENALRALEGKQLVCEIFALGIVLRGILERVEEPIISFPERGSPLRVMYINVRGEDIAGSSLGYGGTSSGASWGQDMFAIPQFAVGELS